LSSRHHDHNMLYFADYNGIAVVPFEGHAPEVRANFGFPADVRRLNFPLILADPIDSSVVYLCGGEHLWRLQNIAKPPVSSDPLPQDFTHDDGDFVTAAGISSADYRYWYVATQLGRCWYSHDAGITWALSTSSVPGRSEEH